ncbi:MAG: S41 family peptidase [Alphaproteobacteria bacterium]
MRLAVVSLVLTIALTGAFFFSPATAKSPNSETYRQLNLFGDVFERVRSDYVTDVEDQQLIEDAINGMLAGLDPHSSYLNPRNFRDMQVSTRGEFGGLGIEVTMDENARKEGYVQVVSPMDNTPAYRAGIQSGDRITHLDGDPILGKTLLEAIDIMRGRPGTDITLTIQREKSKPFDVTITRATIPLVSVSKRMEENVAYVRISNFNEHTADELDEAITEIKKDVGDKMQGMILDLRNNPGGLLDQAIAVSDYFLTEGEIVSTRGRHPEDIQRYNARRGEVLSGKPIIVLINGGSASASEIVAGALQDRRRATVLGTKSFGKGSVQTVIPLNGGTDGALRLTTAKYYTPSGNTIHEKGIEPDIEVKLPEPPEVEEGEEPPEIEDTQLNRALKILRGVKHNSQLVNQKG